MNDWPRYLLGHIAFYLIVGLLGISGGCVIFYGLIDRAPPRENIIGTPNKPAYHACEFFDGTWTLDYMADKPGLVIRKLTSISRSNYESILASEDVRAVSARPRALPAARYKLAVASFRIPCQFPPGLAYYQVTVEFANNWLQELLPIFAVSVPYPAIEFTVLPPIRTGM